MREIRAAARRLPGVTIERDREAEVYRATAPDGWRFTDGPHELVEPYTGLCSDHVLADAAGDMIARLATVELERCADAACDWCRPERGIREV